MAATYQTVGGGFGQAATGAVSKPAGLAVGELMVVMIGLRSGGILESTFTTPAGTWTGFAYFAGASTSGKCWWKVADSTDTAATSFTFGWGTSKYGIAMVRVSGADATSPIIASSIGAFASTNPITAASVTSEANGVVVNWYQVNRGTTLTTASGLATEVLDQQTGTGTTDFTQMVAAGATTGTTTGAATANMAATANSHGNTLAIRQAGTGPAAANPKLINYQSAVNRSYAW